MSLPFGPRRGVYIDLAKENINEIFPLDEITKKYLEDFDLIYRTLCSVMFNFVPTSGHPGGSISSGRIVTSLLFQNMDLDLKEPNRNDADMISYAAGHKALGLYAMWALRNEIASQGSPDLIADEVRHQFRLEDLLGFRRNPITNTTLYKKFNAKPLDGHPTPATPFLRLSTGASGVGVAASMGLGFAAKDYFGDQSPLLHIIEGEGGLTPGRVMEAMASAGTAGLNNTYLHLDWNQASIDSNCVTRENDQPGDYVQWDPMEVGYLNDWNVVYVPDGKDFHQVLAGQQKAMDINNGQPTMIVYRTIKGWSYGIEGCKSHGAGHAMCSPEFYETLAPLFGNQIPGSADDAAAAKADPEVREQLYWNVLTAIRDAIAKRPEMVKYLASKLEASKARLNAAARKPRSGAAKLDAVFETVNNELNTIPEALKLQTGSSSTLRGELGKTLQYLNSKSQGSILAAAADLLGSTSINAVGKDFPQGFLHFDANPDSRLLSIGGICEDAMSGILAGISSFGAHIGSGSSYGAFMAPLGHIAARLHCIGNQAKAEVTEDPYSTFIMICAHAGLKTGEDGPTHADPQALQILQEAFPKGTAYTLTPWSPAEVWPLMAKALSVRPALLAPFVTRPGEKILDHEALGLCPIGDTQKGVYKLIQAKGKADASIVLQGSGITYSFLEEALPLIREAGMNLDVYYVSSAELFNLLPVEEQKAIFSEEASNNAMGITGFTPPTMFRWITSSLGRECTLYPFQKGHFLGSGQGQFVIEEAGLDGAAQFAGIKKFIEAK